LNHLPGILMMVGGVPIEVAGGRIGAVGVSGASGGERDEVCALAALEKLAERSLLPTSRPLGKLCKSLRARGYLSSFPVLRAIDAQKHDQKPVFLPVS
jgi:hypothetical protein